MKPAPCSVHLRVLLLCKPAWRGVFKAVGFSDRQSCVLEIITIACFGDFRKGGRGWGQDTQASKHLGKAGQGDLEADE